MQQLRRVLRFLPPLVFVVILALPLAQTVFQFAPVELLHGVTAPPPPAPRTLAGWHGGTLQTEIEHGLVQGLGLRDWIVRLDNQLKLALFGVTRFPVLRGAADWLYEAGYLTAPTHSTPEAGTAILTNAVMLLQAQRVLKEHGITMLLVVSPSKVETLPQYLPFPHRQVQAQGFNRDIDVLQAILAHGYLDHLDVQRLFWDWSVSEPDLPLFPRGGVHWSSLACARVVVRLLDQFEQLSGFDLVNLDLTSTPMGTGAERGQNDLVYLTNLLNSDGMANQLPIPVLTPRKGDQGQTAGVCVVSSSFGWEIAANLERHQAIQPLSVFYYFKLRHDWINGAQTFNGNLDTDPAALRADLLRYRFIVVECNVAQIRTMGFGFPEAVLAAFGPPKDAPPQLPPEQLEAVYASMSGRRAVR